MLYLYLVVVKHLVPRIRVEKCDLRKGTRDESSEGEGFSPNLT